MGPLKLLLFLGSIQFAVCLKCPTTITGLSEVFADWFDPTCQKYILCLKLTNQPVETIEQTCPGTMKFNKIDKTCVDNYACTNKAVCPTIGRFPNHSVRYCKGYIACAIAEDQTMKSYNYTCLSTSVFNPVIQACSNTYTCVEPLADTPQ